MCFRITTQRPAAVHASWPRGKRNRYALFRQAAEVIAKQHGLPLRTVADALFLYHDLSALLRQTEQVDFTAMLCSTESMGH